MPKYNWTRVLFPNGEYGYVKTDNNDKAIEYKSDGTFKVYSQPNEKSHSFYTSFETRPRTIQRVPDDHEAHLALQKQVDEKVHQVTPSTGLLFDMATVGGLNNLSPTQWMRRAYDTGQLIQGYMPLNEYMNKLYFGNNGIVSDEYARKHPYRAMAANLAGDIATFGTASTLRKMPSWYRAMLAENQMAQNIVADNWRNIGRGSVGYDVRTGPVAEEIPAEYMPKQIVFIHPAEAARPGKLYIKPTTERVSITTSEPLMAESLKIIHPSRGKFNPILESDIPELQNMLDTGQYREMTIPGSTKKVKMYFPNGNKLPIREDELLSLLSKYLPKRELSLQEKELAKQAPKIIKELKLKYGIDFSKENWFTGRPLLGDNKPGAVTQLDSDIFYSHIPEYAKLAESLQQKGDLYKLNGKWFGKFLDKDLPVSPEEYIVAHSEAFKTNWRWNGKNYLSGMTSDQYNSLLNNGGLGAENWGTTNGGYAGKIASETRNGKVIGSLVGRNNHDEIVLSSPLKKPTSSNYFGVGKSVNNGVSSNGTTDIPVIYDGSETPNSWKVFGEDVLVKVLRGNNGDFSLKYKNPFKVLIPPILGGMYIGNLNKN